MHAAASGASIPPDLQYDSFTSPLSSISPRFRAPWVVLSRTSRLRCGMLFRSFVHAFWQSERNSMDCCGASFFSKAKYQVKEPHLRLSICLCRFFHTMSAKRAFRPARRAEIVRMLFVGLRSGTEAWDSKFEVRNRKPGEWDSGLEG